MKRRVLVLGAGFGGLELTAMLSEALGDELELTLIDKSDSFFFGFSKLDVMFGRAAPEAVRVPYSKIVKPGVTFRQETITAIDAEHKRVTTEHGAYEGDVLVVALGAEYDIPGTPGLAQYGHEFYSFAGAEKLREVLPAFKGGNVIVGVCGPSFKCPPAPSECVLLLHDYLTARGVREKSEISLVIPFGIPIPPSPATSKALLGAFIERGITFIPNRTVVSLDGPRCVAMLDDGTEMPYDLFLGIPRHRVPEVVAASGMTDKGWIPVNPKNLQTRFPGVYAIGDVNSVGTAKAGVFAESAARVVAEALIAEAKGGEGPGPYKGAGTCYIEFGGEKVGRVAVDFLSGPAPTGTFTDASTALAEEKAEFGRSRRAKWFGV